MFCATSRSVLMHFKWHEKYQFSSINYVVMLIIHLMLGTFNLNLIFWIPRLGSWILRQWNLDSGSLVSEIPDSLSCIPDSKAQNSRFWKQKFSGFRMHCRFFSDAIFCVEIALYKRLINVFFKVLCCPLNISKIWKISFSHLVVLRGKRLLSHERCALVLKCYRHAAVQGF